MSRNPIGIGNLQSLFFMKLNKITVITANIPASSGELNVLNLLFLINYKY